MAKFELKNLAENPMFVIVLAGLAALSALSIEIILPTIVPIATEMDVSEKLSAMLIGGYFLSYAVGTMFWGLMSDAFGRKPMLLLGLAGFVLASAGAALASDFGTLMMWRLLQGTLAASPVVAQAIVRDLSSGSQAARLVAVLSAVTAIAPLLAPTVGSGLLVLFSWRATFVLLALFSLAFLVAVALYFPETLATRQKGRLRPSFLINRTKTLFADSDFVVGSLINSIIFAGFASVLTMGSVIAENAYGIAPEAFGSVYAIAAAMVVSGVLTARAMLKSHSVRWVGGWSMVVAGLAVLTHVAFLFYPPSFPVFWGGVGLFMLAFGMTNPIFISFALEAAKSASGFAASLIGAMAMAAGFVSSILTAAIYDGSFRAISYSMILWGTMAVVLFVTKVKRPKIG